MSVKNTTIAIIHVITLKDLITAAAMWDLSYQKITELAQVKNMLFRLIYVATYLYFHTYACNLTDVSRNY